MDNTYMKFLKSFLISLAIILVSSVGVLAQTPTYYIGQDGQPTSLPSGVTLQEIKNNNSQPAALTTGNWYWGGGNSQDSGSSTVKVQNGITLNLATGAQSGEINIVVGPNGVNQQSAMIVTGGLTIPSGITLNIYQAANPTGSQPLIENCLLEIVGKAQTTPDPSEVVNTVIQPSEQPIGIEVQNGGTLKVFSGALDGQGAQGSPGLQVDAGGTVNLSGGQLQGESPAPASEPGNQEQTPGIEIGASAGGTPAGSLTVSGGLLFSAVNQEASVTPISNSIEGTPTYSGGTVWTTTKPTDGNGVWITNTSPNNTREITAFGTGGIYNTGVYELSIKGSSFSIPTDATVNINSDLYFLDGSEMTINGQAVINGTTSVNFDAPAGVAGITSTGGSKLTIGSSGKLTIGSNANVTLGTLGGTSNPSILNNSGTIDVQEAAN